MAITKNARPRWSTERVLLVEPEFPVATKSKNHKDFLPIGLLKLGAWLEDQDISVKLVRGKVPESQLDFVPDEVWITSLFTYWSKYVIETASHYKDFSNSPRVVVGGVYASLMPKHCQRETGAHAVSVGVHKKAESYYPAYHLLEESNGDIDYQVVHMSRGCVHKCKFCGVHIIEPNGLQSEPHILPLIEKPRNGRRRTESTRVRCDDDYTIEKKNLVFYDNNFLANEHITIILEDLTFLKKHGRIGWCESQSGFDGRIMDRNPNLAKLLKSAGFRNPRIAWDWGLEQGASIRRQIEILVDAGYKPKDISVFMIYNWGIPFEVMEEKRIKCFEWGVQISDCRYRPLDADHDEYNPRMKTQDSGYYVHSKKGWSDRLIRTFRRNIRRQNICIRHGFSLYSKDFETKKATPEEMRMVKETRTKKEKKLIMDSLGYDRWDPSEVSYAVTNREAEVEHEQAKIADYV